MKNVRPTDEEFVASVEAALQRQANAPCARGHKPPENLAEWRKLTPEFLKAIREGGREQQHKSRLYETPEELQERIDKFFDLCDSINAPPNVSLLAEYCGCDSETFQKWERDPDHILRATIKKAKDGIAARKALYAELGQTSAIMAIFGLKAQNGWIEEQHINLRATAATESTSRDISDEDFARQAMMASKMITDGF